jgi:hypothetical protein
MITLGTIRVAKAVGETRITTAAKASAGSLTMALEYTLLSHKYLADDYVELRYWSL